MIVGTIFFLSWTAISLPATMDMVSSVLPKDKRTMGVSIHALVRRIPMALGPMLGGWMIGLFGEKNGVRLAFVAFSLSFRWCYSFHTDLANDQLFDGVWFWAKEIPI